MKRSPLGKITWGVSGNELAPTPEERRLAAGQIVMERSSVDQLSGVVGEHWDIYRAARKADQLSNASAALREVAANVERFSILSGEMAQAKAMSLKDVTIDEKLITAFLEAASQRPDYIVAHLYKEIRRIGWHP
jgi:hypothetical protein